MRHLFNFFNIIVLLGAIVLLSFCRVQTGALDTSYIDPALEPEEHSADSIISTSDTNIPMEVEVSEPGSMLMDVFSVVMLGNCAVTGCHDGNFEPNYLTPMSFYTTTVLQPVIRNSSDNSFEYRVMPYDTTKSLLYERITNCCFINENDLMPILMPPLEPEEIEKIANWIAAGAPDWKGEFPWKQITPDE